MFNVKTVLLAIAILLVSCFNIADINWRAEQAHTRSSSCNTNEQLKRGLHLNSQVERYILIDGKIAPLTTLNEAGLQIMESNGCLGCHQDDGGLSSTLSIRKYKEPDISDGCKQQNR